MINNKKNKNKLQEFSGNKQTMIFQKCFGWALHPSPGKNKAKMIENTANLEIYRVKRMDNHCEL
jgi:hypothetical protein